MVDTAELSTKSKELYDSNQRAGDISHDFLAVARGLLDDGVTPADAQLGAAIFAATNALTFINFGAIDRIEDPVLKEEVLEVMRASNDLMRLTVDKTDQYLKERFS